MILPLLSVFALMAVLVYVIHFFNNSLNKTENYYETKEHNSLEHVKRKSGTRFLDRMIKTH